MTPTDCGVVAGGEHEPELDAEISSLNSKVEKKVKHIFEKWVKFEALNELVEEEGEEATYRNKYRSGVCAIFDGLVHAEDKDKRKSATFIGGVLLGDKALAEGNSEDDTDGDKGKNDTDKGKGKGNRDKGNRLRRPRRTRARETDSDDDDRPTFFKPGYPRNVDKQEFPYWSKPDPLAGTYFYV